MLGVRDSNITVNNSPMVNLDLEVNIPGQPPFHTRKRTVISRLSVGALMPGAVLPVLADPAKSTDVVIDWNPAGADAGTAGAGAMGALGAASLAAGGGAGPALAALFRSGRFGSAIRLNSTGRQLGILFGPAVGGALMLAFGPGIGMLVNANVYLVLAIWALLVQLVAGGLAASGTRLASETPPPSGPTGQSPSARYSTQSIRR